MHKKTIILVLCTFLLVFSNICISFANIKAKNIELEENSEECGDDFYFIQITDTHVMHRLFDRKEEYKNYLAKLIDHINSFENKPAFIVLTGDLVSAGGGIIGSLNFKAFLECVYKKDGQIYTDESCSIPIYTIPGNHDYYFHSNLYNYHRYIDNKHVVWINMLDLLENRQLSDRYILKHENLTMFFLNTGPDYRLNPMDILDFKGSGLSYWFDIEWLETVFEDCNTKHKIILMHHPAINWGEKDIIAHNRETFIRLCEGYNIDLVLAGHTHASRVFDKDKNFYPNNLLPFNCSQYPTLYVQTDACKEESYYRNITISKNHIILNPCEKLEN